MDGRGKGVGRESEVKFEGSHTYIRLTHIYIDVRMYRQLYYIPYIVKNYFVHTIILQEVHYDPNTYYENFT